MNKKKSDKKQKKVAVLFSSGLDSTYLVWKNLKEGNKVLPFYIEIKNNVNKSKIEKQNILLLFEKFRAEFGNQIEHPELILSLDVFRAWNGLKFQQVPIWLFALNYVRDSDVDEIQIGYVSNDDALSYTEDIRKTFENQQWLFNNENLKTRLTFPLTKEKKEQMLKELRETPYAKFIFSCENPKIVDEKFIKTEDVYGWKKDFVGNHFVKFENCGDCVPCSKILQNSELRHMYIDYVNEDFKRLYLKNLETEYLYHFPKRVDQLSDDDSVKKAALEVGEITGRDINIEVKAVEKVAVDSIEVKMNIEPTSKILLTDVDGETIGFSKGVTKTVEPWDRRTVADSDAEYEVKEKKVDDEIEEYVNTEEINDK